MSAAQTTLGIDLASQPENTAVCLLAWQEDRVTVALLVRGSDDRGRLDDDRLLELMLGAGSEPAPAKIGIDAPLGWPLPFIAAVSNLNAWPLDLTNEQLARRQTDIWVRERLGKVPLSVSTDRIAYPAIRAARLLRRYEDAVGAGVDRSGFSGPIAEVYPDTAMTQYLLRPPEQPRLAYKGPQGRTGRSVLMGRLEALAPWLEISSARRRDCIDSDDLFDALIAALLARSVQMDLTLAPDTGITATHRLEGWIHVPRKGGLAELAPGC